MTQTDLGSGEVSELRREYRKRVNEDLPERAKEEGDWPIHLNHCFGRVVLDNLFGDEWYSHVDGRPAYQHLSSPSYGMPWRSPTECLRRVSQP